MASRTLPGLGLNGFWALGEDGWKTGMDANLLLLSAIVQAKVLDRVAAEPGSPSDGDMYILTGTGNINKLAVRDNGAWTYITPAEGYTVWVADEDVHYNWNGTAWSIDPGLVRVIGFVIDGAGSTITTGVKGDTPPIPFACTIIQADLLADQSGSIVVDIWKDTYANFPPVIGDKITASAPPTISSATKSTDSTLTGWTTSIAAGDILRFNVNSVTTIQRVTVGLKVRLIP